MAKSEMKSVLVLGASGGIGSACCEIFGQSSNRFEVIGVSRTVEKIESIKTLQGDLRASDFRSSLLVTKPQVVIATFGQYPVNPLSVVETINEFAISTIDLYEKFEATEVLEDFVVISSLNAQMTSLHHHHLNDAHFQYGIAKRFLSDFFRQEMLRMKSRSKIFLVEPGFVKTGFANIENRLIHRNQNDPLTRANIEVIDPRSVARMIFENTTDPNRQSRAVTIYNSQRRGLPTP
jgi:NADP-dependent 3-hydroxy acid dehydrogenase YdfG